MAENEKTAVRLSDLPDVAIKKAAEALYIHPFMLSRWRKKAQVGLIGTKGVDLNKEVTAELKKLHRMKKDYEHLKLEHGLSIKLSCSLQSEKRHLHLHRPRIRAVPGQSNM